MATKCSKITTKHTSPNALVSMPEFGTWACLVRFLEWREANFKMVLLKNLTTKTCKRSNVAASLRCECEEAKIILHHSTTTLWFIINRMCWVAMTSLTWLDWRRFPSSINFWNKKGGAPFYTNGTPSPSVTPKSTLAVVCSTTLQRINCLFKPGVQEKEVSPTFFLSPAKVV